MKSFEVLKYETPDDTDTLESTWNSIRIDLKKNIKTQVVKKLKEFNDLGVDVSKCEIVPCLDMGVIEILYKDKAVIQLRD